MPVVEPNPNFFTQFASPCGPSFSASVTAPTFEENSRICETE